MMRFLTIKLSCILLIIGAGNAASSTFEQNYELLYQRWATANYVLSDMEQTNAYANLIKQARMLVTRYPLKAESFILLGLVESSYAPLINGTRGVSIARDAKKSLERSLHMNDSAINGQAYSLLGALYNNVPEWPFGFGSNTHAHKFLEKALKINPDGLEANYSYASLLFGESEYQKAKIYLEKALKSRDYLSTQIEDESRREKSRLLLNKVNQKLNEK